MTYDMRVFISYKHHGADGHDLPDVGMASELYSELRKRGINAFFSSESVIDMANSDYKALIDESLDKADILVLVSTDPENCQSEWVRYEWDGYYKDILSGRKGMFVSYLDYPDIMKFPRTIRSNEIFQRSEDGLNRLLAFIENYIATIVMSEDSDRDRSPSHYRQTDEEKKRLSVQASVEIKIDMPYICDIVAGTEGVCNVLDVGCSTGSCTFMVFSGYGDKVRVIGVDKDEDCVADFNLHRPGTNMKAYCMNVEDDDWMEKIRAAMAEENIPSFDLVYCALSLHHMADSGPVIRNLHSLISDGGTIYIRTCDDGLKISYPNSELIADIIQKTAGLPHIADRFHGRKVFKQLYDAGFGDISMKSALLDTCGLDTEARESLFQTDFEWRRAVFYETAEAAEGESRRRKMVTLANEMSSKLDKVRKMFANDSYYYGGYVTIGMAKK